MIEQNTTDSSNIDNASIKGNNNKINISSIIEDNSGGLSSTRIMMIMWLTIPLLVWVAGAIVALYHGIYTYPTPFEAYAATGHVLLTRLNLQVKLAIPEVAVVRFQIFVG